MNGVTSIRRVGLRRIVLSFGIGIFFVSSAHLLAPPDSLIDRFAAVSSAIAFGFAAAAMTYGLYSLLKQQGEALLVTYLRRLQYRSPSSISGTPRIGCIFLQISAGLNVFFRYP